MKGLIKQLLRENLQLADKVYFNSGKLSPRVREIITHITNGDPYTKILTDIYYTMLMDGHITSQWALKHIDPSHQESDKPDNDVMGLDDLKKLRLLFSLHPLHINLQFYPMVFVLNQFYHLIFLRYFQLLFYPFHLMDILF